MDRREFLKVTGAGALTLFLSGCGINAVSGDKKAGAAASPEAKPGGVSQVKKLKIVVLCGSPHKAGTSALLADKFIEGAQAAGHEVFRFNAAFEDIHPCNGCDACGMNGPCVINDAISQKLIQKLVDCVASGCMIRLLPDGVCILTSMNYLLHWLIHQLSVVSLSKKLRKTSG